MTGQAPVGVVLAAGRGRRFGGPKQLALLRRRPLVGHVLDTLAAADLEAVVVVGPPWADAVVAAVEHLAEDADWPPPRFVTNDATDDGIGSSLAAAAEAVGQRPLVVVLGDQPGLRVDDVTAVVDALAAGARATRIVHPDRPGHPVGFAPALHPHLVDLDAGEAGRDLLEAVPSGAIEVSHAAPPDIDEFSDLRAVISGEPEDGSR